MITSLTKQRETILALKEEYKNRHSLIDFISDKNLSFKLEYTIELLDNFLKDLEVLLK